MDAKKYGYTVITSDDLLPGFDELDLVDGLILNQDEIFIDNTITGKVYKMKTLSGDDIIVKPPINIIDFLNSKGEYEGKDISYFQHPDLTTSHREALTYITFSSFFKLYCVPTTTIFKNPHDGSIMSAQLFIKNSGKLAKGNKLKCYDNLGYLYKFAIADTIIGNHDRNRGNVLCSPAANSEYQTIYLIDNALSFDFSAVVGANIPAYANHLLRRPIPNSVLNWVKSLNTSDLITLLEKRNVPTEIISMTCNRINAAQQWVNYIRANRYFSKDLGMLLEFMRSNFFCDKQISDSMFDVRSRIIRKGMRGEPFVHLGPNQKDKTKIIEER